jgi:hypothetical protein
VDTTWTLAPVASAYITTLDNCKDRGVVAVEPRLQNWARLRPRRLLSEIRRFAYTTGVETKRWDKSNVQAATKKDYVSLASLLEGRENVQRVQKKDPHGEALRTSGELYANREYVSAYECLKPAYDKVVADMRRVLARNMDFEANKVATQQRTSLAVAKENVKAMKAHAQQVIDQFDRLLQDLESKALVRVFLKKRESVVDAITSPTNEPSLVSPPRIDKAQLEPSGAPPSEVVSGGLRFRTEAYSPPEVGTMYSVRDKTGGERIVQVTETSDDGASVQVVVIEDGKSSMQPIQITVDSLARQAARGWCSVLVPIAEKVGAATADDQPTASNSEVNVMMRLDSQNFGRCCADIVRANIRFNTQLIKDVGDGPFRAGNYEQAFLTFEQLAVGFNSAVASSRRAIADGRRLLTAEKGKLSSKEIQERTAAFIRSEQLIHTAEREFSTILEGLRMYLRAQNSDVQGQIDPSVGRSAIEPNG